MVDVWYSLYDRMLDRERLHEAFRQVKSAKGAAGIDGQSVYDFAVSEDAEIDQLLTELQDKSYRPMPVLRVEIPKPAGGVRKLGIPAVRDRVVQQVLLTILQPIFDPAFHPSSYGYRPGRNCQQAITKACLFIRKYDRKWVVDMDLSKCFDTLSHSIVLSSFRKRVRDGSILNLLEMFLKSGVMTGGSWQSSDVGSPQGGVISPMIANVYLDAFDQFMKERGHRIIRYADDILILCSSRKAALNAQKQASEYLEEELLLKINKEKTHICHSRDGVKFLGVIIRDTYIQILPAKLQRFKERVKAITRRNSPVNLEEVIKELNYYLRGYTNYFRIANCKGLFRGLSGWIRRRLRARQLRLWKKPGKLHRRLRQLGYTGEFDAIKMNSWRNAASPLSHYALPNKYLHEELGLFDIGAVTGISVSL
jgi:group II intron reverse transcriptase/maturase